MNRRNAGFSLIEVMCAILILGIALVGLTGGITTALTSSKEAEVQTIAALIAAGQIELLRAENFLVNGETEDECGNELPLYRWRQTVSSTEVEGLHEVTVVVENSNSGKMIYELKTLLFDVDFPGQDDEKNKKRPERSKRGAKI
ncbi:MAG: prepilin-type N-terminal cleavage/methylation domain-containing protein [Verrucomicrobia bacterium]|nr:prepilin-type N-terminal cleavage/methylation domain-containing protein [Verrucomicrobiota bacterium]